MSFENKNRLHRQGGVVDAIGRTPLVQLRHALRDLPFRLHAKLEGGNPGGSIKDRAALRIIQQAIREGRLDPDSVVIESSSGNMGIGLAQICRYHGLRFICVVDSVAAPQNIRILRAYGAEVHIVDEPDPVSGTLLGARLKRVTELLESTPGAFWSNQYANLNNALAHQTTMQEISEQLDGAVDYLVCATSTCGTIRGCSEYALEKNLGTRIFAVDAVGSLIFGGKPARRRVPGHGAGIRPELVRTVQIDRTTHVSDLHCVVGCRRLLLHEALLVGGSSGGLLSAVDHLREVIAPDTNCVMIFADRGERYLDTIYSDAWVRREFGEVSHLWEAEHQTV